MSSDGRRNSGPKIIASIGKGGVGKTTMACSLAYFLAGAGFNTRLYDCNKKGRGISRCLSPEGKIHVPGDIVAEETSPIFDLGIKKLKGGALFKYRFESLIPLDAGGGRRKIRKLRDGQFEKYMEQFPGPYGIIPFNDLLSTFYGAFTSPQEAADFVTLSELYHDSVGKSDFIILDMKASDDFAEMFSNSVKAAYSLENMAGLGFLHLGAVSEILRMPDLRRYLETDFVRKFSEIHAPRFREAAKALVDSNFILVCGPESEKVDEMLNDIQPLVNDIEFQRKDVIASLKTQERIKEWRKSGKKGRRPGRISPGTISGKENSLCYVVNNLMTSSDQDEMESQERQVEIVRKAADKRGISVLCFPHDKRLGAWDQCPDDQRRTALKEVGNKLVLDLNSSNIF